MTKEKHFRGGWALAVAAVLAAAPVETPAQNVVPAPAQPGSGDLALVRDARSQWWARLALRETFDTKFVPQPAYFQYTDPRGADASIAVGAALKYQVSPHPRLEVAPAAEYARNTDAAKEQDVLKLGIFADWLMRDIGPENPGAALPSDSALVGTPNLILRADYKRDGVKETAGVQGTALLTAVFRCGAGRPCAWYIPNERVDVGFADFQYSPYAGMEVESVLSAPESGIEDTELRPLFRVQAALYPRFTNCRTRIRTAEDLGRPECPDRVQLTADWSYRADLLGTLTPDDQWHSMFEGRVDVYLVGNARSDRSAAIGLSYVVGEDPSRGFERQELTRLAFKVLLK
jgi:hypothetical protein